MKRFLTLMSFSFSLFAGDEIETANVYANTGFYQQAETLYRQILSKPHSSRQQDILYYNLGTLYLKQGLWDQAIEEFIEITGKNLSPDLTTKLNRNLLLALDGAANRYRNEGDLAMAIVLLSIDQEKSEQFHEVWKELPPHPARNSLLRALRDGHNPDLDQFTGYPLELVTLATDSAGVTRKIALIAALAAVNRQLNNSNQKSEAIKILKKALEEEQRSFDLTFLINVFKLSGPISPQINQFMESLQSAAIQTANGFVPAAVIMQQNSCQKSSWNRVFPPFGQGLQAAQQAQKLLYDKQPLPFVDDYQNETLKLWKTALDSLEVAASAQAPEETKAIASQDVKQLIQTVIEMDFQDDISEQKIPDVKRIDRPW